PLALSPDKRYLFAINTPDNRLEVFRVTTSQPVRIASIPVGLEPVAVAARTDHEVWVVNHLSDSVSVVELDERDGDLTGQVARTLLVGDEPRDIVFAGPGRKRAFITTAHRGQNIPFDPQLTTPGVGRADVWVFDAEALGSGLGGTPQTIVTLFTDTPRALAVTPDGSRVYAAGFPTGNQTTSNSEVSIPDGFGPDGVAGPVTNAEGRPAPEVGAIVKWNGTHWVDSLGRSRDQLVRFSLPDKDVFVLDAMANPPRQLAGAGGFFQGVGTILFTMVVNPVNGKVYVANTDANNADRFEGPGTFAGHSLRGHLHESRITVLSPGSGTARVAARHLNKHIDYTKCCAPIPNDENARSLAFPQGLAVTRDGATLYVAALGSGKVGIFSTAQLENNTFVPSTASQIPVSGGGPTGLVLDEDRKQLYVMTRFDNGISILDTKTRAEAGHVLMHTPEPPSVVTGRRFLYDAQHSSSHGDSACASCHVFGDFDSLAWDLGNPDGKVIDNPGPFNSTLVNIVTGQPMEPIFHPMKGPMTTQSLRGMANHGPMHWRGDRTGGNDAPSAQPDSGTFDEHAAFAKFNAAFPDLLGRHEPLSPAEMNAFTDFILQVTYPPNPNRPISNVLTADQRAGRKLFETVNCGIPSAPEFKGAVLTCNGCHTIDSNANPGTAAPGFFGSNGRGSFDFNPQLFKAPHLRNAYQKIGRFGSPENPGFLGGDNGFKGDQVRGFGFLNDGNIDTIFRFVHGISFSDQFNGPGSNSIPDGPEGEIQRRQLEAFILAFPTNMAPAVGQQITLTASNSAAVGSRINLLRQRADSGECDLVAKTRIDGDEAGFLYVGSGSFLTDRRGRPPIADAALRSLAKEGRPVTYTCVPPGSGERVGVDRDGDGSWDGDERDAHTDPADPDSRP
ncbi:MAG TPA: hypothetical protein VGG20_08590, partial [Thermoanaerobaculia bacterium]